MAGMVQIVLAAATVVLVFGGSRWAPHAAIVVGFVSAVGFTAAAHLLPTWGFFSDSFIHAPPSDSADGKPGRRGHEVHEVNR